MRCMPLLSLRVLIAVLIVAGSAACTSLVPTRIRVLVIANSDVRDIPLVMAVEELRNQGYQIEITPMMSGALMADALSRGDAELASFNNETLWAAIAKGLRAKTIVQRLSFPNLVVTRQGVTCRAMNGRPLAIGSQTGLNPRLVSRYFESRCPGTEPQVLVIPDSAARTAALVGGTVDAALLPLEEFLKLQKAAPGKYATLVDLTKEFPQLQVNAVQARGDWLEQHPREVREVIRTLLLMHRRINTDPRLLYGRVFDLLKIEPAETKPMVDALIAAGAWDPNGALTKDNVQYTLTFLQETGAVPKALRVEDVADLAPLNDVLNEIGRQ
jgi:ABC-type nitrate/sulfonate/bicarbonate transport system substrate-binding protein